MSAIDSSFNDDLLILTFGELGMSEIKVGSTWVSRGDRDCFAEIIETDPVVFKLSRGRRLQCINHLSVARFLESYRPLESNQKEIVLFTKWQCIKNTEEKYTLSKMSDDSVFLCGAFSVIKFWISDDNLLKEYRRVDPVQDKYVTDEEVFFGKCDLCLKRFWFASLDGLQLCKNNGGVCSSCRCKIIEKKAMKEPVDKLVVALNLYQRDDTFNDDTPAQTFGELITCVGCLTDYGVYSEQQKIDNENSGLCLFCQQKKEFLQRGNKSMRLIGIAGPARAGKDTLASYLLDNLSDDWTRSSFADPLKNMLSAIGVDCSDDAKAVIDDSFGVTPRHMMQTLGTEWGRHMIDDDIWVKAFARLNAGMCVIVPDVRFENEADLIRDHGVLIHLAGRGGIEGNHASENPIDFKAGDIVIDNSRDLAWLHGQVDGSAVLDGFIAKY